MKQTQFLRKTMIKSCSSLSLCQADQGSSTPCATQQWKIVRPMCTACQMSSCMTHLQLWSIYAWTLCRGTRTSRRSRKSLKLVIHCSESEWGAGKCSMCTYRKELRLILCGMRNLIGKWWFSKSWKMNSRTWLRLRVKVKEKSWRETVCFSNSASWPRTSWATRSSCFQPKGL